ncbi:MAG: MaoC/PaaZ C-terminal domain-containing protein, partial [Burkholderiaceae bacterium]|nr:MaoC/PaaZ C-terminal domain-containing protein [Burkholderiaceae bacterium]
MRMVTQRDFDRFAALSRDDNPIHCDAAFARGTHFGATVAHGMFLYGLICGALTRKLATPWLPVAQTLMFPAPTFAGDTLAVRLGARESPQAFDVGIVVERDGRMTDTVIGESIVMRTADGDAGRAAKDDGEPDTLPLGTGPDTIPLAERPGSIESTAPAAADAPIASLLGLEPGQRAKAARRFDAGDLDEYADLCDDANPVVVDIAAARRAGLPGRVVPGPLLASLFSDLLGTKLPGRGTGWMKQSLRFLKPAHSGQSLHAMVEVVRVRPDK